MQNYDLPIGIENYSKVTKKYYIDKTMLIKDLIDYGEGKAILLTRPRRFGKSLALSTVDYFFNVKEDSTNLFNDKLIFKEEDLISKYMNQYPVVHLNMKGIECSSSFNIIDRVMDRVCLMYRNYPELLSSDKLSDAEKQEFSSIYNKKYSSDLIIPSLERLTRFLYKHYERKIILLIDEYDAPIQSAYDNGHFKGVMSFFKSFYGDALKGNDSLYFAFISGVLQISKESLFSGLNNLMVSSINSTFLSSYFGFSKEEVEMIIKDFELNIGIDTIEQYYGGYYIGNQKSMFNPWSVLNFVNERKFRTYWANTGTNELLTSIIGVNDSSEDLLDFLNNKSKKASFNPAISFFDINKNLKSSLSFLAQAGYLTIIPNLDDYFDDTYEYRIPNIEIFDTFRTEIIGRNIRENDMSAALKFKKAIFSQNVEDITSILEEYLLSSLSYYDLNDERNYHNSVTGLISVLFDNYIVKNEVDSGLGRCDILILPKRENEIGIVIEIKRSKAKNQISKSRLDSLAKEAIKQIKKKDYIEILRRINCRKIIAYGFAFQNKKSSISTEEIQ